jgi:transposase-like protein
VGTGSSAMDVECIEAGLSEAFSLFRRDEGLSIRTASKALRRMAVDGVSKTGSVSRVARACGVTPKTIRNWIEAIPPSPRRLSVLDDTAPARVLQRPTAGVFSGVVEKEEPARAVESLLRFRLGSGVSLEATAEQALWLVRQLGGDA